MKVPKGMLKKGKLELVTTDIARCYQKVDYSRKNRGT